MRLPRGSVEPLARHRRGCCLRQRMRQHV